MNTQAALHQLKITELRPNNVHTSWETRVSETQFREDAVRAELADAVAGELLFADAREARYVLWLTLELVPDGDIKALAAHTRELADPDARILTCVFLIGRTGGTPEWLPGLVRDIVAGATDASRNMKPHLEVLDSYVRTPARFEPQAGLAEGQRLFEAERYFEAHEVWEDVWRTVTAGADRDFFQALINLAVGLKKGKEGNANGMSRLLRRAANFLETTPDMHRGIDIQALRTAVSGEDLSNIRALVSSQEV